MDAEGVPFQKIIQSLANLSEEELLNLEKRTWDLQIQKMSDPELKQRRFSAEAEFSTRKADEESLSFDAIKQAIGTLNPAEISVLHSMIMSHLDKEHRHDGLRASASWGTTSSQLGAPKRTVIRGDFSAPRSSQPDPQSINVKAFQEITQLITQVEAAKRAGDKQRVLELVEEAIRIGEQAGIPSYMLEHWRELFLSYKD